MALLLLNHGATQVARNVEGYGVGSGEASSLGLLDFFFFFDLSAFGLAASVALVSAAASVLLALSDFLDAASVLYFSLVLLVLVFGDVAAFSVGLVSVADLAGLFAVADSAGLLAVEAGAAVALAAGLVAAGVTVGTAGADGEALAVALAEGVIVAAAVAAGVAAGVDVAATLAVAAGVALALVDALVLEVVVAPVVVPEVEVMPTLKFGTVTP